MINNNYYYYLSQNLIIHGEIILWGSFNVICFYLLKSYSADLSILLILILLIKLLYCPFVQEGKERSLNERN